MIKPTNIYTNYISSSNYNIKQFPEWLIEKVNEKKVWIEETPYLIHYDVTFYAIGIKGNDGSVKYAEYMDSIYINENGEVDIYYDKRTIFRRKFIYADVNKKLIFEPAEIPSIIRIRVTKILDSMLPIQYPVSLYCVKERLMNSEDSYIFSVLYGVTSDKKVCDINKYFEIKNGKCDEISFQEYFSIAKKYCWNMIEIKEI